MIEAMEEYGPTLLEIDIDDTEIQLGFRLPPDYRAFLLKYNGGRPSPRAFPIRGLAEDNFGLIHAFFTIGGPIASINLDWNYEVFNGRLPANLFAIACDPGSALICVSLFGDDAGHVFFWDFRREPTEPSYENVYHIANSFPEFLDSIQELPEVSD